MLLRPPMSCVQQQQQEHIDNEFYVPNEVIKYR